MPRRIVGVVRLRIRPRDERRYITPDKYSIKITVYEAKRSYFYNEITSIAKACSIYDVFIVLYKIWVAEELSDNIVGHSPFYEDTELYSCTNFVALLGAPSVT